MPANTTKAPNPTDKHVGSRLRMRRLMLGMSQTALADALGITFQQVQKYEKGTNRISASRLQDIAHALQIPASFFFEDVPGDHRAVAMDQTGFPAHIADFLATPDGLHLAAAFVRIKNTRLRRSIVELVEQIVDWQSA